ncbi:MAG: sugar ABC transporter permease [Clostridia bacterium]|nr:sugar ABC transporter permease [Clostridia bacterium]
MTTASAKERIRNEKKARQHVRIKKGKLARREALAGLLFVLPWIIGAIIFLAYPLVTSFTYGLNNIRITPKGYKFKYVGYGNYTQILLSDTAFLPDLADYVISTLISVPVIVVFALLIAMMLNMKIRGRSFFRVIFFLPVIIVSGPILGMLTEQNAGSISAIDTQAISAAIGSFLPEILAKPVSGLFANMVTILWYSGVPILLFLSGLQKIDSSMYEASYIDGAGGWETFWKITLPQLKNIVLLSCVYTIVFVSSNDNNTLIALIKASMFSGTKEKGYGYASAMAWLYSLVVLLIVGLFALILTTRKDKYEKEARRTDRELRKEARKIRKVQRRQAKHAKRYQRT